ncbi:winged helix-turn-helix domain-containing protein [Klebsiella sp. I138]|uniref:winged helix-turn-helix domain-containing protein n=1 Tax=Klebsiella sp. I138 TaxID=2755385 RepID=UPI003DA96A05
MFVAEKDFVFNLYCCSFGKDSQVTYHAGSGYIAGLRGEIRVRRTMENLLIYLLENAHGAVVSDESLMLNVWEENSLSSSTQRLGQVIKALKNIIVKAGIEEPVIFRLPGRGYTLDSGLVFPMYSKNHKPVRRY